MLFVLLGTSCVFATRNVAWGETWGLHISTGLTRHLLSRDRKIVASLQRPHTRLAEPLENVRCGDGEEQSIMEVADTSTHSALGFYGTLVQSITSDPAISCQQLDLSPLEDQIEIDVLLF